MGCLSRQVFLFLALSFLFSLAVLYSKAPCLEEIMLNEVVKLDEKICSLLSLVFFKHW